MKLRGPMVSSLFVCSALLVFAAGAFAAEEGGANSAAGATGIFKWINFAIVAGALIWVFSKVLPPTFRGNADKISSAISKAQAAKAEADRKLRDAEQRLLHLEEEVRGLREQAQRDAAAEAERIRALAESDAEKVAISAKAEIAASERAARIELKTLAAKLAVDGAEARL